MPHRASSDDAVTWMCCARVIRMRSQEVRDIHVSANRAADHGYPDPRDVAPLHRGMSLGCRPPGGIWHLRAHTSAGGWNWPMAVGDAPDQEREPARLVIAMT